ncbi:MAG: DNA-directed RNA polymerase [Candidatus Micrarchaeota archaeon]
MYYLMNIEEKIRIHPSMLTMNITNAAKKVLRDAYERRIYKEIGLILSIDNIEIVSPGVIVPGDPNIYYNVQFDALVFNTSVNEVFESVVKEIVEFGAFTNIGPFDALLHLSQISGEKFFYDKKNKSLYSHGKKNIKKDDILFLKVSTVSIKSSINDTKIGLTMRAGGLGKTEWFEENMKKAKVEKNEKKKA